MCGRYTLRRIDLARSGLDDAPVPALEECTERPRFNIAPSQDIPVVRIHRDGGRAIGLARWGLIPHWAKALPEAPPINARAETVATSPDGELETVPVDRLVNSPKNDVPECVRSLAK